MQPRQQQGVAGPGDARGNDGEIPPLEAQLQQGSQAAFGDDDQRAGNRQHDAGPLHRRDRCAACEQDQHDPDRRQAQQRRGIDGGGIGQPDVEEHRMGHEAEPGQHDQQPGIGQQLAPGRTERLPDQRQENDERNQPAQPRHHPRRNGITQKARHHGIARPQCHCHQRHGHRCAPAIVVSCSIRSGHDALPLSRCPQSAACAGQEKNGRGYRPYQGSHSERNQAAAVGAAFFAWDFLAAPFSRASSISLMPPKMISAPPNNCMAFMVSP